MPTGTSDVVSPGLTPDTTTTSSGPGDASAPPSVADGNASPPSTEVTATAPPIADTAGADANDGGDARAHADATAAADTRDAGPAETRMETPEEALKSLAAAMSAAGDVPEGELAIPWEVLAPRIDPAVGACFGVDTTPMDPDEKPRKSVACRSFRQLKKDHGDLAFAVGLLVNVVEQPQTPGEPSLCTGLECEMEATHSAYRVHFAPGGDGRLVVAGVFVGDGLIEDDQREAAMHRTRTSWRARIAERFGGIPWTGEVARAILGPGPEGPTIAGHDAAGQRFGYCAWACPSRVGNHEITCSLGPVGPDAAAPAEVSFADWLATGMVSVPAVARPRLGDHLIKVLASVGEDEITGRWRVTTSLGKTTGVVMRGSSEAFEPPVTSLHPTADGRVLGVGVRYSGDHGCGLVEAKAVRLPEGLVVAYLEEGLRHHRAKRLPEARAAYEVALALDPMHPKTRYNKGCALALAGDAEGAAAEIRYLLQLEGATWKATIEADSDFDGIRTTAPYLAAMGGGAPVTTSPATEFLVASLGIPVKLYAPCEGALSPEELVAQAGVGAGRVRLGEQVDPATLCRYGYVIDFGGRSLAWWPATDWSGPAATAERLKDLLAYATEGLGAPGEVGIAEGRATWIELRDGRFQAARGVRVGARRAAVEAAYPGGTSEPSQLDSDIIYYASGMTFRFDHGGRVKAMTIAPR